MLAAIRVQRERPGLLRTPLKKGTVKRCASVGRVLRYYEWPGPDRPIKSLTESVGTGAIELIINGSPAFRCVYVVKFADMIVVLHSFVKTTNRSDRHAMQVAEERMKELKHELRKMGYRV